MPTPKKRRFQGKAPNTLLTGIIGAAVLAAALNACDVNAAPAGPQWVGMCVNSVTGMRMDDYYCGLPSQIYTEDYIDTYQYSSYAYPRVGAHVNIANIAVVHNPPAGSSRSTSLPSSGGSASSVRTSIGKASAASSSGTGSSTKSGSGSANSGTANSSGANKDVSRGGLGVPSKSGSGSGSSIRSGGSSGT